jgi:hypothetical protein
MKLKIKNPNIKSMIYNNSCLYIKCNRLWNIITNEKEDKHKWGISLIIDKIKQ